MLIGDVLIDKLIASGDLPYDYEFRVLGIDKDRRSDVVTADILAKIGLSEPSGEAYLTGPLPDCVMIPSGEEQLKILQSLDEDYYRLADLWRSGQIENASKSTVYNAWISYIKDLNPDLYKQHGLEGISTKGDPVRKYLYGLNRVIISDEALYGRYQSKERLLGAAAIERRILHTMLLDNHMELGVLD